MSALLSFFGWLVGWFCVLLCFVVFSELKDFILFSDLYGKISEPLWANIELSCPFSGESSYSELVFGFVCLIL